MKIANILLALAFGLLLLWCLSGCKAVEKYKSSDNFAADCAAAFPVKTDSIYVEGEPIHDTVTTYNYGIDTVVMVVDSTLTKYIYKDRIITRTVTVTRVDTVVKRVENTAAVHALMNELKAQDDVIGGLQQKVETRSKHRLWLLIALLIAAGAFFAVKRR